MKTLHITKPNIDGRVNTVLSNLRTQGETQTDSLEVLDQILFGDDVPDNIQFSIKGKIMDKEMLKRLRDRGLDVRPS